MSWDNPISPIDAKDSNFFVQYFWGLAWTSRWYWSVLPTITFRIYDCTACASCLDRRWIHCALTYTITTWTLNQRTQSTFQICHFIVYLIRQKWGFEANWIINAIISVMCINLHGFDNPLWRGVYQLSVSIWVTMVTFTKFTPRIFLEL